MVKKLSAVAIIVLFVSLSIIPSTGTTDVKQITMPTCNSNTLYVGGTGPGNYSKIQDAIDNASDGDTVFVYNGVYPDYVRINKLITLIGEDKNNTIIEGGWGSLLDIDANGVLVTGFTIRYCGFYHSGGITVSSNNNMIIGNILKENIISGMDIYGNFNTITKNIIEDNRYYGIRLESARNNTIVGNVIDSNDRSGILFSWHNDRKGNVIEENIIVNSRVGIEIRDGDKTIISNNTITDNWCGIELYPWAGPFFYRDNTWIKNNTISNNAYGIWLEKSNKSILSENTIAYNNRGLYILDCNSSKVYHNNFIKNKKQAIDETENCDECTNQWDNSYPTGGNYWSDYSGLDNYSGPNQDLPGRDGIGDTQYNISGNTNSHDRYPLMEPYGYDTLPPITTVSSEPETPDGWNNWYISNVTVTIKATDDWSGVNTTFYRINGGNWNVYTRSFVLDEDGRYDIEYYSLDNVGNVEDKQLCELKLDQTSPHIELFWEIIPESWTVIFTAVADDDTSGMNQVCFYLNDELQKCVYGPGPVYVWITEMLFAYRVVGLMLNPEVSNEYLRLYALIVAVFRIDYDFFVKAVAYDNAGNSAWNEISLPLSFYINPGIYVMKELILPADFEGYIGGLFIRATFFGRPLPKLVIRT